MGCESEGWHQLGASLEGLKRKLIDTCDVGTERMVVEEMIRSQLEPVQDSRALQQSADTSYDDSWKAQWSVVDSWERDGEPFLDNGEGKQRWRSRRRGRRRMTEGSDGIDGGRKTRAGKFDDVGAAGRHVVSRRTSLPHGTRMAKQHAHQSDGTSISRVVPGSTSAVGHDRHARLGIRVPAVPRVGAGTCHPSLSASPPAVNIPQLVRKG